MNVQAGTGIKEPTSSYLNLKFVEFIITYQCNSHCKHCHVDPRKRSFRPAALTPELAERAVRELASAYSLDYVMTFGGEPLLYPETVYVVHATARDCGVPGRCVITNASYPTSEEEFRQVANKLNESGVNSMHLSVDAFHQEYLPLEVVKRNAILLIEAGIEQLKWNTCWVVSPEADNPWNTRTRFIQAALSDLPIQSDDFCVDPEGQALINLVEYLPSRKPIPAGKCGDKPYTSRLDQIKNVTVDPDGSLDLCYRMFIGSLLEGNAAEICQAYDPYQKPLFKLILEEGPIGLLELMHQRGLQSETNGYYTVCGMCEALRRQLV